MGKWSFASLSSSPRGRQPTQNDPELSLFLSELSKLLADPAKFPVIAVFGSSSNGAAALYRLLPCAAHQAFLRQQNVFEAAASEPEAAAVRPAAMRVVTHAAAALGPETCAANRLFIDAAHTSATPTSTPLSADGAAAEGSDAEMNTEADGSADDLPAEAARRARTSSFTDQYMEYIDRKCGGYNANRTTENALPSEFDPPDAGATEDAVARSDGVSDGALGVLPAATVAPSAETCIARVQWVVPLWLGVHSHDLRVTLHAWRKLFSGTLTGETVSLILFLNNDIVDDKWYTEATPVTAPRDWGSTAPSAHSLGNERVFWRSFAASSPLSQSLQHAIEKLPPTSPLRSCVWREESLNKTGMALDTNAHATPSAATAGGRHPCVCLPCLSCWRLRGPSFLFRGSVLSEVWQYVKTLHARTAGEGRGEQKQPNKRQTTQKRPPPSLSLPAPTPPWRWLLSSKKLRAAAAGRGERFGVPADCGISDRKLYSLLPNLRGAREEAPVFPYILVCDQHSRDEELKRAVQRNVVAAAVRRAELAVKELQTAAATAVGGGGVVAQRCDASGTAPHPRYYAPLVADAGSPLTFDGVLSDIFVLEFSLEVLEDGAWEQWSKWIRRSQSSRKHSSLVRLRFAAMTSLLEATEAFLNVTPPNRTTAAALLTSTMQLISLYGRGRGVMVWPLVDPREGHRRLRVAFALTHDFFFDPLKVCRERTQLDHGAVEHSTDDAAAQQTLSRGAFWNAAVGDARPKDAAEAAAAPSASTHDFSLETTIEYVLRRVRPFGWVLVWQEQHTRWPTAVAPPCLCEASTGTTSHFLKRSESTAPASVSGPVLSSEVLRRQVAVVLEQWRQTEKTRHHVWYDRDPGAEALEQTFLPNASDTNNIFAPTASDHDVEAMRMHYAPALRPTWRATSYTSLDVWQAALVPEEAGMHLWEGQTVFLDSGQCGTIVAFKPPPTKLFEPWSSHATEAERHLWRGQQEKHADFLRYHAWRQRVFRDGVASRHAAAAYSALPHHVVTRELDVYPVVSVCTPAKRGASPPVEKLIHVLPTRVDRLRVKYPRMSLLSVQEQERWYAAHPTVRRVYPFSLPLRTHTWARVMSDHRHADHVTLLSLPLSPHRVETRATFFLAQVFAAAEVPPGRKLMRCAMPHSAGTAAVDSMTRLAYAWARLHRVTRRDNGMLVLATKPHQPSGARFPIGFVHWPSFLRSSQSFTSAFRTF